MVRVRRGGRVGVVSQHRGERRGVEVVPRVLLDVDDLEVLGEAADLVRGDGLEQGALARAVAPDQPVPPPRHQLQLGRAILSSIDQWLARGCEEDEPLDCHVARASSGLAQQIALARRLALAPARVELRAVARGLLRLRHRRRVQQAEGGATRAFRLGLGFGHSLRRLLGGGGGGRRGVGTRRHAAAVAQGVHVDRARGERVIHRLVLVRTHLLAHRHRRRQQLRRRIRLRGHRLAAR
eukprot:scaffold93206_cov57-Phaeocystis_antarctica.AAC.3